MQSAHICLGLLIALVATDAMAQRVELPRTRSWIPLAANRSRETFSSMVQEPCSATSRRRVRGHAASDCAALLRSPTLMS